MREGDGVEVCETEEQEVRGGGWGTTAEGLGDTEEVEVEEVEEEEESVEGRREQG